MVRPMALTRFTIDGARLSLLIDGRGWKWDARSGIHFSTP